MAITSVGDNVKAWEVSHSGWECNIRKPLWKIIWLFFLHEVKGTLPISPYNASPTCSPKRIKHIFLLIDHAMIAQVIVSHNDQKWETARCLPTGELIVVYPWRGSLLPVHPIKTGQMSKIHNMNESQNPLHLVTEAGHRGMKLFLMDVVYVLVGLILTYL